MIGLEQIKLFGWDNAGQINPVGIFTWNTVTLAWERQAPISPAGVSSAVTTANGADVAEGTTTDAAVVADTAGTISGKLRGLVKWAFERMPAALGQGAMAQSLPVAIASNQSAVPISAAALPLPAAAATAALQTQPGVDIGDVTINNAAGGAAINIQDGGNSVTVDGVFFQATQPVSVANGADVTEGAIADAGVTGDTAGSVSAKLRGLNTETGILTEAAPATDTASSGLNGRLQRIAQRLTSLIALLPAALVGGRLDTNIGAWLGATTPTVGQKTSAASIPVTLASDQSTPLPAVAEIRAATLGVTATAAVNTALTLTLPAAGAGLFHYIVSLELVKLYNIVGVAAGAGVIATSTNMPGGPAWTTEQLASAAGTAISVIKEQPTTPLKSSAANTATTFVAPAQLQTIWRWNVRYFTAT